jgi:hypothetical protein
VVDEGSNRTMVELGENADVQAVGSGNAVERSPGQATPAEFTGSLSHSVQLSPRCFGALHKGGTSGGRARERAPRPSRASRAQGIISSIPNTYLIHEPTYILHT